MIIFGVSLVHHRDFCCVCDSVGDYETCLQKNSCKNSEIQYIPLLVDDKLCCSIFCASMCGFYFHELAEIKFIYYSYNWLINPSSKIENPLAVEECGAMYALFIFSSGK